MDACASTAATAAARRHAVAATRVTRVAEASVRAVRLCAESGGLVVILFSSVFQLAHLAGPKPVYHSQCTVRSVASIFSELVKPASSTQRPH